MRLLILLACFGVAHLTITTENRETQETSETEDYGEIFRSANREFSLRLYNALLSSNRSRQDNLVVSPFSVSTILSMVYYGARGKTAHEIRNALGYRGIGKAQLGDCFSNTIRSFHKNRDCVLSTANSIWPLQAFAVSQFYKERIELYFEAEAIPFDLSTGLENMNSWVANKTNNMIPSILEDLPQDVLLVLINAIYFKGPWKTSFDPNESVIKTFKGLAEVPTTFMKLRDSFGYHECSAISAKVLELPYKGENISMYVALPNEGTTLETMENSLTVEVLFQCIQNLQIQEVQVSMPKFKSTSHFELLDYLRSLGISKVFSYTANLGGICERGELQVSQVVQKSSMSISEEGAEASAASAAVFYLRAMTADPEKNFNANRPFMYILFHKPTSTILFMGRFIKVTD